MRRVMLSLILFIASMCVFAQNELLIATVEAEGGEQSALRLLVREPRVVVLKSYEWNMVFDTQGAQRLSAMLEQGLDYFRLVQSEGVTINVRKSIGSMDTSDSKMCQVLFENRRRADTNHSFVDLYYFEHTNSRDPSVIRLTEEDLGELVAALDSSQQALDDLERQLALF